MAPAQRESAPYPLRAVRASDVEPAQAAGPVPELPNSEGRVGVDAARGSYPGVGADWNVACDEVHDPAERGGPVQRGNRALYHFDALHVGEGDHVPVDSATVALVRRHAVHEQQHPGSQSLHEAARAPDVDLAAEKLHTRSLVYGLVDGAYRAPCEIGVGDEYHAGGGLVEKLRAFGRRHDHRFLGRAAQVRARHLDPDVLERGAGRIGHRAIDNRRLRAERSGDQEQNDHPGRESQVHGGK